MSIFNITIARTQAESEVFECGVLVFLLTSVYAMPPMYIDLCTILNAHTHTRTHTRTHAHTHAHAHTHTHAYTTHAYTDTETHTHTQVHTHTRTHKFTHTHTYTPHTHRHTRAHTNVQLPQFHCCLTVVGRCNVLMFLGLRAGQPPGPRPGWGGHGPQVTRPKKQPHSHTYQQVRKTCDQQEWRKYV